MELLKIAFAALLILFGVFIIGCSWVRQVSNAKVQGDPDRRWSSPVPFLGPILCIVGYASLPVSFTSWAFVLFALDPDTVVVVVGVLYLLAMRLLGRSPQGS